MIQFVLETDRQLFEDAFQFAQLQVRKLIENQPGFYPMYTAEGRWKGVNTSHLMDAFIDFAPKYWGLSTDTLCGPPTGGKLPMGLSVEPRIGPNVLAIGDAAGSINPFNGEGIAYGYETGRLAAACVGRALSGEGSDALVDYDMLRNLVTVMFPNSSSTILAGNWIFFYFRPNGNDPDSSIFEVDFLHRFPDGQEPEVVQEFYPDWTTHKEWGITLEQDFSNMPYIQRGLHSANGENVRLGRQEVAIRNLHRILEEYIYAAGGVDPS